MERNKILFLLKRREDYSVEKHSAMGLSTGLYNSAFFMHEMLINAGVESKLSVVVDNNSIDKEVTEYRPTHVIIEALWVVPTKFFVLCKLHPTVKWIIRLHSEVPFLAGEGMAFDWISDYSNFSNITIAANGPRALKEVRLFLGIRNNWDNNILENKIIYLPNFYPQKYKTKKFNRDKGHIDISCFGAVRPLKNHILQVLGALKFAKKTDKKLKFHVNAGRIEMQGGPVLSNLKDMFIQLHDAGHELINHEWTPREEFLKLCSKMDIGMQVSFSETFNIVGADHIIEGVPLVGSVEIPWINKETCADVTETDDIYKKLLLAYEFPELNVELNRNNLDIYTTNTRKIWLDYFKK